MVGENKGGKDFPKQILDLMDSNLGKDITKALMKESQTNRDLSLKSVITILLLNAALLGTSFDDITLDAERSAAEWIRNQLQGCLEILKGE